LRQNVRLLWCEEVQKCTTAHFVELNLCEIACLFMIVEFCVLILMPRVMTEPDVNTAAEQLSRQTSQTVHITTRVADVQFTGMIATEGQCESSDDEVVEALCLCNPLPDTGNCGC